MTAMSSTPTERAQALLAWYGVNARDLPWRHSRDPYAIWISEIMLQQTQVATVLPRYSAWLQRFPDVAALAAAESNAVMKAWEGLGYYRRARLLHEAAKVVIERHGGRFPAAFADICALPGIGRSTAGAISAFCFDTPTPVLDGNVKRVLRRWYGLPAAADKQLWTLAQRAIAGADAPAIWNQAMMEIGALVCLPRRPACTACPVQDCCTSAFREPDNAMRSKPMVRTVHWQVYLHLHAHKGIWLMQRPTPGIWAGLWAPPISELAAAPAEAPVHVHHLTHRRLHLYPVMVDSHPKGEGCWVKSFEEHSIPTGIHRLLEKYCSDFTKSLINPACEVY
jgi:A/G-specific adenine glycosylase